MNAHIDIQSASREPVPEEDDFRRWISAALAEQGGHYHCRDTVEISVRLVDTPEMTALNETYRGKSGPTNVLAFPADIPPELEQPLLGDIVICAPVVQAEARSQGKSADAHWAHMAVHGSLHLLGFDHEDDNQAAVMEALESRILQKLNFDCPYEDRQTPEYSS